MKNNRKSIGYLIIVFFTYILYYFEDMKTSSNIFVKQTESRGNVHILLMLLIAFLMLYFVVEAKKMPNMGINIQLFVIAIWMAFVDIYNQASIWSIAVRVGLIVLWFLISFFSAKYIINSKRYKWMMKFEILIWIVTIYYSIVALYNYSNYHGNEETSVLNISYNILVLLPIVLQLKNKKVRSLLVAITTILIMISMKRGAIITFCIMLVVYLYIQQQVDTKKKPKVSFIIKILASAILLTGVFWGVDELSGGVLSSRFTMAELRNGSNRSNIYSMAWQDIRNRSFAVLVIGRGSGSAVRIIGTGVHNELLEFLFSYGIVGAVLYSTLVFGGIKKTIQLCKGKVESAPYYGMSVAFIIMVGVFGSALFAHYAFHIMLTVGLSFGYLCQNDNMVSIEKYNV